MNNQQAVYLLLLILAEADAIDQYFENADRRGISTNEYFSSEKDDYLLLAAFTWADTPQGYDFWKAINKRFTEELYNDQK